MERRVLSLFQIVSVIVVTAVFWSSDGIAREIVDQAGRKVTVPEKVERIVTAYRPATCLVYVLGAQDRLLHVSSVPGHFELISKLTPGVSQQLGQGTSKAGVNIESIVAVKPDLIIMFPTKEGIEYANKFESLGIATIVIDPESLEKLDTAISLVGKALGLEERRLQLTTMLDNFSTLVSERTKDLEENRKLKVYYAASRGITTTSSASMMQHFMINRAGGRDVVENTSGGWINISIEQLMAWNPDVIFLSQTCKTKKGEILSDPRLMAISAVKRGLIYQFPSNLNPWDYPGPENYLAILWMSSKLYPERFQDIDIAGIVDEYYKKVYGQGFFELGGRLPDDDTTLSEE